MVSFSHRFTSHAVTSSHGVGCTATVMPVMLCGRPNRCSSEMVAVRFNAASWRSYPKGVSNRPADRAMPFPTGTTAVTLNRWRLTSVVTGSLPNCSVHGAVPGHPNSPASVKPWLCRCACRSISMLAPADNQGAKVLYAPMVNWSNLKSMWPGSEVTGAFPANSGTIWMREL